MDANLVDIAVSSREAVMSAAAADEPGFTLLDTSRVSTFFIAIMLIVYGSFRSINLEAESRQKEKAGGEASGTQQTLDSTQAVLLPIGASVSLLIMFFFFDSLQTIFALCTAVIATIAFAFLLLPMCQFLVRPFSDGNKISFGVCGRYACAELFALVLSCTLVTLWVLTGHWILMDALGMGLCVAFIALVRLPSLKVSTVLLSGLLLYDIFWVFFSSYIFNANVMVRVATRPADNPMAILVNKLNLVGMFKSPAKLSLPGKLVFPSSAHSGAFTMLGLGDIVMPGLLLCFVMRYDAHKRAQYMAALAANGIDVEHACAAGTLPSRSESTNPLLGADTSRLSAYYNLQRMTYFHCSLIGYFLGLLTATVAAEWFAAAQPALLYLVPFTLLPLMVMAYIKGDLRRMWHEPFLLTTPYDNDHETV